MITSIKLFYNNELPMVAIYGEADALNDGWQCNLPGHQVVNSGLSALPLEQQVLIGDAEKMVSFTTEFIERLRPAAGDGGLDLKISDFPAKTLAQYAEEIAPQTNLAVFEVLAICRRLLNGLLDQMLIGQPFHSRVLEGAPAQLSTAQQKELGIAGQHCLILNDSTAPKKHTGFKIMKPSASAKKAVQKTKTLIEYSAEISKEKAIPKSKVYNTCQLFLQGLYSQLQAGQPFRSPILCGLEYTASKDSLSHQETDQHINKSILLVCSDQTTKQIINTREGIQYLRKREKLVRSNVANRIAVVTMTFFPRGWVDAFIHHYLQHSSADIYILTFGQYEELESCRNERVRIVNLPTGEFNDGRKGFILETFASMLRVSYKYTILCDVDELVMPFSTAHKSILPSIDSALFDIEYTGVIRTCGINVVQSERETPYNSNASVLAQRTLGRPLTAMNKVMIIGDYHPVSIGQHSSSVPCECLPIPSLSSPDQSYLFLNLHMKHACVEKRREVLKQFQNVDIRNKRLRSYYNEDRLYPTYPLPFVNKTFKVVDLSELQFMNYLEKFNSQIDPFPKITGFCYHNEVLSEFLVRLS